MNMYFVFSALTSRLSVLQETNKGSKVLCLCL